MYEHNVSLANYLRVVAEHDEYNEHNVWNVWFLKRLYRWKFQCNILLRKMCKAKNGFNICNNEFYLSYLQHNLQKTNKSVVSRNSLFTNYKL